MTTIIRCVFNEGGKIYPQLFLDDKILVVFYNFFYKFFLLFIKMSEITDLTYYKKDRNAILNKTKDYYKNNNERLKEQARDK